MQNARLPPKSKTAVEPLLSGHLLAFAFILQPALASALKIHFSLSESSASLSSTYSSMVDQPCSDLSASFCHLSIRSAFAFSTSGAVVSNTAATAQNLSLTSSLKQYWRSFPFLVNTVDCWIYIRFTSLSLASWRSRDISDFMEDS